MKHAIRLPRTVAIHLAAHANAAAWLSNESAARKLREAGIPDAAALNSAAYSADGVTVDAGDLQVTARRGVMVARHGSAYVAAGWDTDIRIKAHECPDVGAVACEWKRAGAYRGDEAARIGELASALSAAAAQAATSGSVPMHPIGRDHSAAAVFDALTRRHDGLPGHLSHAPAEHPQGFVMLARRAYVDAYLPARLVALPGMAKMLCNWITSDMPEPYAPAREAARGIRRRAASLSQDAADIGTQGDAAARTWAESIADELARYAVNAAKDPDAIRFARPAPREEYPQVNYSATRDGLTVRTSSGMAYTVPAELTEPAALLSALERGTAPRTPWGVPAIAAGQDAEGFPVWLLRVGCHNLPLFDALPELRAVLPAAPVAPDAAADDIPAALKALPGGTPRLPITSATALDGASVSAAALRHAAADAAAVDAVKARLREVAAHPALIEYRAASAAVNDARARREDAACAYRRMTGGYSIPTDAAALLSGIEELRRTADPECPGLRYTVTACGSFGLTAAAWEAVLPVVRDYMTHAAAATAAASRISAGVTAAQEAAAAAVADVKALLTPCLDGIGRSALAARLVFLRKEAAQEAAALPAAERAEREEAEKLSAARVKFDAFTRAAHAGLDL